MTEAAFSNSTGETCLPADSLQQNSRTEQGLRRGRLKKLGLKVLAAATVATGVAVAMSEDEPLVSEVVEFTEDVADFGVTVTPPVSSSGTEVLIAANDFLRSAGPYVMGAGALSYAGLSLARRRNEKLDATYDYVKGSGKKSFAERALPPVIIASVAVASGLGDLAGDGANEPVRVLSEIDGSGGGSSFVLMQHENVTPFNHSSVTADKLASIQANVLGEEGSIFPFTLALGDLRDPSKKNNPSSAPIVALPNESIQTMFGVDLSDVEEGCGDMSVIVGSQLGSEVGDSVIIEGTEAVVAGTIDIAPGLDRVIAVGSLEQMHDCIFEGMPFSGAVVVGIDDPGQLQAELRELGIAYDVTSFSELEDAYTKFWDRSVKPVEMQLVLLVLGTGIAGVTYIRNTEVLKKRKDIATLIANGVQKKTLQNAENLRSVKGSGEAALYAVVPAIALTAMTNSSQFGLEQPADVRSIGAGYMTYLGVSLLGSYGAKRLISRMDAAKELRS